MDDIQKNDSNMENIMKQETIKSEETKNTDKISVTDVSDEKEKLSTSVDSKNERKIRGGKFYLFLKRFFDIFASFLAIIILSPLLLITGILVKITSRGPILFKDKRVGKNGKTIKAYKFRTMYKDAEKRIKDYLTEEEYNIWLEERKLEHDPRITKIGRILRKTSIDELPQLFNILFGSMSFVGPRPISENELKKYYSEEEQKILLCARPGLTGYWQTHGRSQVTYQSTERQRMELEYFEYRSIWFDLKLIFKTFGVLFKSDEAH